MFFLFDSIITTMHFTVLSKREIAPTSVILPKQIFLSLLKNGF